MVDERHGARGRHVPGSEADDAQAAGVMDDDGRWSTWSNLWQVPSILASIVVILLGLYVAMKRAPANDFDGAFDRIDQLIAAQSFETAAAQLNKVIEPNLDDATPLHQARFEATVADWISLSQKAAGLDLESNNRRIDEHYRRAVDLGAMLDAARIERWADAVLSLGDFETARRRLSELEDMADAGGAGLDVRRRRNHVLRRIVEVSLDQPDLSFDGLMELLEGYRGDPMLTPQDELWAIARQAELRLEAGMPQEALDHLLLDIRRSEPTTEPTAEPGSALSMGELYALLGRAYYDLGNHEYASFHVGQAMEHLALSDPARAAALVLQGRLAVADGLWQEAFGHFDEVVRNYGTSRSLGAGLLGRAEVHSVLGDGPRSLADYKALRAHLDESGPRRDITPERIGLSLADRHDAALTMGKLDSALEYITLAESFFTPGQVPADIHYRIASTSRQRADDIASPAGAPAAGGSEPLDPALRFEANKLYRQAGDYYVKHARALTGRPGEDENWAESLWLAADSYDLGGWYDLAVSHFTEYLAGRSDADPRRVNALFRLAQAYHANLDYESAATFYRQVIDQHPRSPVASRSFVPLARCLLAVDRKPEAQQQLMQVLTGRRHLDPEAMDYRDALIELGSLFYDTGDFARAIEQLDEASRRYTDDARIAEIRFRLADSYRRRAAELEQQLGAPLVPPAERRRLEEARSSHLSTAADLFGQICTGDIAPQPLAGPRSAEQIVRYACLYRADCVFELELYTQAVELYDQFASRFSKHHSSMTALIQIVNCYSNLGDVNRARTAHRRALVRLKELPDEAFRDPDALLDRAAWERWLANIPIETASAAGN